MVSAILKNLSWLTNISGILEHSYCYFANSLAHLIIAGNSQSYFSWLLVFKIIALFVNLVFLGQAFTLMLVYIWSRRNRYVRMNFFGLFPFKAPLLPWVLFVFSLVFGNSVTVDLIGNIFVLLFYFSFLAIIYRVGICNEFHGNDSFPLSKESNVSIYSLRVLRLWIFLEICTFRPQKSNVTCCVKDVIHSFAFFI